ncbi:MAG: aminotransferase class IV [Bacteroidota bacterium]|nr:aminotransferase class IV [Bacteroidota bacterium]
MSKIVFNQHILNKEEFSISLKNRAFLYGDGLFESMKIFAGKAFNLDAHLNRIFIGAKLLNLDLKMNVEDVQDKIKLLLKENRINNGRLKIMIFRDEGGKYLPANNQSSFLMMCEEDNQKRFELNINGLELGLFSTQLKSTGKISNFKTTSALQSVLCSIEANKNGKDDCLMFNTNNNLIESANSNVFYVKDDIIYTPKLSEGCVDGTMRNLIMMLKDITFQIKETTVTKAQILKSDEVFLTNAIQGVSWVGKIDNSAFKQQKIAQHLVGKINQLI